MEKEIELCNLCHLRPVAPGRRQTGRKVTRCAECRAEFKVKYSPEAQRQASARWLQKNPTYIQNYYQANREKRLEASRNWHRANALQGRASRYGLTLERFNEHIKAQEGRCPICDRELVLKGKGGAQIDHEPGTSRVRGILCRQCNVGLGMFGDNAEILAIAIRYLQIKT